MKIRLFMLEVFIRTMVYAAEQLKLTQVIDSKLDWVTEMAQDWCDERGIAMSLEEIRARIEAAVRQEFPKPPTLNPPLLAEG